MEIREIDYSPDDTYFRTGDVEPDLVEDGTVLKIYSGRGSRRGWGTPGCNSNVILNDEDLVSIHVGFFHKHGGGQFWRHYKNNKQVDWKKLDETDRLRILDAHAPSWAKSPGKLKRDYIIPSHHNKVEKDNAGNIIAYKLLKVEDGQYISPIHGAYRWQNGELGAGEIPTANNASGIYAAKTPNSPILTQYKSRNLVLVQLILSGTIVEANYGYRAEYAQILREVS